MALSLLKRQEPPSVFDQPAAALAITLPPLEEVLREGRVLMTPAIAARILEELNYSRQRRIKPWRLNQHLARISRGQWDADCTIRLARLNGKLVLVDGQHRLTAICQTGKVMPFIIVITDLATESDLHQLYSRIDVDGNRSVADILLAADPTAGRAISLEMRRNAYKAMGDLANDFPHRKLRVSEQELVTKEDRIACMSYWLNELEAYDAIVNDGQSGLRKRLRVPGIISVALATLKSQPERARSFWSAVAQNDRLRSGDPAQALVTFLQTSSFNDAMNVSVRGAVQAWNSWFRGRSLKSVKKTPGADTPIAIAGTPFQGFKGSN